MANTELLAIKLGKKLRELRLAKGYSQEGFADAAKLDRAGYGRIERGEVDLRLTTVERLAKALRISMGELFSGLDKPKGKNSR
jgi:transcriptional regulator with XRE-family HTH domain